MSRELKEFVDSLDNPHGPWRELRTNPELISDGRLSENDQKLLTRGPRADALLAAGRGINHPAVIVVWPK